MEVGKISGKYTRTLLRDTDMKRGWYVKNRNGK